MNMKSLQAIPPWDWPEHAGQDLLRVLKNKGAPASDRLIAAELAGNMIVINDELAEVLMTVLSNPGEPEETRAAAAISFGPVLETVSTGEFGDEFDEIPITEETYLRIQQTLRRVLEDESAPKLVRRRALEASVRHHEDWHPKAAKLAYASPDPEWVLTAVFAMGHLRGFNDQILESLQSKDPLIHMEAVSAAGTHEIDAAWDHIAALITGRSTPKPLLLEAIEACSCIRPAEAIDLLHPLVSSTDADISEAASDALSMAVGYAGFDRDEEDEEDDDEEEDG